MAEENEDWIESIAEEIQDPIEDEIVDNDDLPGDEPEPGDEPQDKPTPGGDLKVALREERERVKAMREQMKKYDTLWERLDKWEEERLNASKPKEEPVEVPDFNADPTAHLKHETDDIKAKVTNLTEAQQRAEEQAKQAQEMQAVHQQIGMQEQTFVAEHPDYYDALNHVRQIQINAFLPLAKANNLSDIQVQQAMAMQEFNMGRQALKAGLNPAEYVYNIAKQYGYQPKKAEEGDDLDTLKKGLQHSGPKGGQKVDKDTIDDMEFAEFENTMKSIFG